MSTHLRRSQKSSGFDDAGFPKRQPEDPLKVSTSTDGTEKRLPTRDDGTHAFKTDRL